MSEGSLSPERYAEDLKKAAERFDVVITTPNTLLLDLDTPEARAQFDRVLPVVTENFGVVSNVSWPSKSGNLHIVLTLRDDQPMAIRFALQSALGSDGVREVLGLKRMLNGVAAPSVLFRPRQEQSVELRS